MINLIQSSSENDQENLTNPIMRVLLQSDIIFFIDAASRLNVTLCEWRNELVSAKDAIDQGASIDNVPIAITICVARWLIKTILMYVTEQERFSEDAFSAVTLNFYFELPMMYSDARALKVLDG